MTQLSYTNIATPYGTALIAASEHGLSFLGLEVAPKILPVYFPATQFVKDESIAKTYAPFIKAWCAGAHAELKLDLRGTPFQQKVWQALANIPRGEVRTYSQIASALNRPEAVRAVANACAANPVSLFIPCHRVVRTDGGMGGYAWGVSIKERLLADEQVRLAA